MKPLRRIAIAAVSALTGIAGVAGVIGVSTSATPALTAAPPAVAPHALALRPAAPTGSDGTTTAVSSTPNPSSADQTVNNGVDTFGKSTSFVSNSDNSQAPTGTVVIRVDGTFYTTVAITQTSISCCGGFTYSILGLTPGTHTISADYSGDGKFAPSSGSTTQVVNPLATTTGLAQSSTISGLGETVTFTATVAGSDVVVPPSGQVQFFDGGSPYGAPVDLVGNSTGGVATLNTAPSVGVHNFTARYLGDTNNDGSVSNLVTHTVTTGSSLTELSSSPNPSACTQSVLFEADVLNLSLHGGQPTGTVTFFDGATALGTANLTGGIADLSTTSLTTGSHSITATYNGDANFDPSTSLVVTQVVNCVLPVAVNDTYTTPGNVPLTVADPGVLANDTVPAGDGASLQSNPAHGTVVLNPAGGFLYTPTGGYFGADTFTYCVSADPSLVQCSSNVATVTITMTQAKSVDDTYTTPAGTTLTVPAPGVLANDTGLPAGAYAKSFSGPSHGTYNLNHDGSFTYTPTAGYAGTDTFTYCIIVGGFCTDNGATVTITVTPQTTTTTVPQTTTTTAPQTTTTTVPQTTTTTVPQTTTTTAPQTTTTTVPQTTTTTVPQTTTTTAPQTTTGGTTGGALGTTGGTTAGTTGGATAGTTGGATAGTTAATTGATAGSTGGQLARTGSNSLALGGAGIALLAAGALMVYATRKKPAHSA